MGWSNIFYVLAAVLFILGIKQLSHPKTARNGNLIASIGMLIAIVTTLVAYGQLDLRLIAVGMIIGAIIGATFAIRVEMTQMPQLVAIFNGFGINISGFHFFSKNVSQLDEIYKNDEICINFDDFL